MFRKILFSVLLVLAVIFFARARIVGLILAPKIESRLTEFFGMRIKIKRLHVDPLTGHLWARSFQFRNPEGFSNRPHINLEWIDTRVDVRQLFQRKVMIARVDLKRLDYLIERKLFGSEPDNNAHTMVTNIRRFRKRRSERLEAEAREKKAVPAKSSAQKDEQDWIIDIREIHFKNGSFTYEDYTFSEPMQFFFTDLDGRLKGFTYPAEPDKLSQEVKLRGHVGKLTSVPFWIEGRANFSSNIFNFDLMGKVEEGPMKEYRRLWSGLPISVRKGSFELFVHAVCRQDMLKAKHTAILKALKMRPEKSLPGTIWGIPTVAAIRFLQTQHKITLQIPLEGDITDPKFDEARGFRTAFQEALKQHTRAGLGVIVNGTTKLATHTQALAVKASQTLAGGLQQVKTAVKAQAEDAQKAVRDEKSAGKS